MKYEKRKKIKKIHNIGADRYLITYADLITLLLGLFVILYASSQVDSEKFKVYSAAFSEYFKAKDNKVLQGGDGVLEGHKKGVPEPILPPATQRSISEITKMSESNLTKYLDNGSIHLEKSDKGLKIIMTEKLLFKSAQSSVESSGLKPLEIIAEILQNSSQNIMIDGHTDADKIKTFQYESNWHLSVARAANIAYKLISYGMPEHNLVIRGFGAQRPVADNTDSLGKSLNRRVEIYISELTPESPSKQGYE